MSDLRNPTKEEVRNFLDLAEGNENGIYNDIFSHPTHGLGIRLDDKESAFLKDYITELGLDPLQPVPHYVYENGKWIEKYGETKYLIDELNYLFGNTSLKPFDKKTGIPLSSPVRMLTQESQNIAAFDNVVYEAYLNSNTSYKIGGISKKFSVPVWEKLNSDERLALYSLNYNGGFNTNVQNAIKMYTNQGGSPTTGNLSSSQFIGKVHTWASILYFSNKKKNHGIENRRFREANKFLGIDSSNILSQITVNNLIEANIAIAYMNQNYSSIRNQLKSFGSSYSSIQFASGQTLHLSEMKLTLNQLDTAETINLTGNGDTVYPPSVHRNWL